MSKFESIKGSTFNKSSKPNQTEENWTRWIPDPFSTPITKKKPTEPKKTVELDLAAQAQMQLKLEQALLQAQKKGYAEGYEVGYAEGNKIGQAEGLAQGLSEGTEQGHAEGYKEGQTFAKDEADHLKELNNNFSKSLLDIENEIGQNIVKLSVRIAEQVLHSSIKTHPEKILELIDDILHLNLDDSTVLQLYVNPQDHDLISKYIQNNPDTKLWRTIPDSSIMRGGCKAHTALGDIDATIETRWRRVISTLGEV